MRTSLIYYWISLIVESLRIYVCCVLDLPLNLLRPAQELLLYTGLLKLYRI